MKKKLLIGLLVIVWVTGYLVISDMDYQDQLTQQDAYCKMVQAGYWPAYQDTNCD